MSKDLEHIDKFFEQKLGSSQVGPPSQGWTKLSESIDSQKGVFIFFAGSNRLFSAIFIMFLTVSWGILSYSDCQDQNNELPIISSQITSIPTNKKEHSESIKFNKNKRNKYEHQETTSNLATDHIKNSDLINDIPEKPTNIHKITIPTSSTENTTQSLVRTTQQSNTDFPTYNSSLALVVDAKETSVPENSPTGTSLSNNWDIQNSIFFLSPIWIESIGYTKRGQGNLTGIVPSAVNKNFKANPLSWTLSAYSSVQRINTTIRSSNEENIPLVDKIRSGLSEYSSSEYGIRLTATARHWHFETGLSMVSINQQELYKFNRILFDTVNYYDPYNYFKTIFDTIASYAQVGTDTVWIPIVEERQIEVLDSVPASRVDSISYVHDTLFANNYRYYEVPLMLGYSFRKGRFTYILKSGIVAGILRDVSAYSLRGETEDHILKIEKADFPAFSFDLITGFEARYFIGNNYYLFSDLFYRKNLTPFYSTLNISRRMEKYGIKLGIGIHF
jgi:hypothetical protein